MCVWEESVNYSVASDGFFPFYFFSFLSIIIFSLGSGVSFILILGLGVACIVYIITLLS